MHKTESKCFDCGATGHYAADCPNTGIDAAGKPPWCGYCDERTRLMDLNTEIGRSVVRCRECHPLARKQLKQHRKCPHCHVTVYEFDHNQCGNHTGPEVPDKRPDRQHIDRIVETVITP